MGSIIKKIFTIVILPLCIAALLYLLVDSIQQPVKFNKIKAYRESIAVQRLKDIRDLQVAYKNVNGRYVSTIDSLKKFYNEGKMEVVMQVGSQDDSVAVANTQALKKRKPKIKPEEMLKLYNEGKSLVFKIENEVPVKDTLFSHRENFVIDSLAFIPFCGDSIIMASTVKRVSGVNVPLFEASMPWKSLLKGLNNQLRINLDAQCEDQGRYKGLQVGSVDSPNNNAGNWE